jgi:hypothetical protein
MCRLARERHGTSGETATENRNISRKACPEPSRRNAKPGKACPEQGRTGPPRINRIGQSTGLDCTLTRTLSQRDPAGEGLHNRVAQMGNTINGHEHHCQECRMG